MESEKLKSALIFYVLGSFGNFLPHALKNINWIFSSALYAIGFIIIIMVHMTEIKDFFLNFSWRSIKPSLALILSIAIVIGFVFSIMSYKSPEITITSPRSNVPVTITSLENTVTVEGELREKLARKNMFIYVYKFGENRNNHVHQITQPDKDGKWKVKISLQPGKNILVAVAVNDARTEFYDKEIYQSKDFVVNANLEEK